MSLVHLVLKYKAFITDRNLFIERWRAVAQRPDYRKSIVEEEFDREETDCLVKGQITCSIAIYREKG